MRYRLLAPVAATAAVVTSFAFAAPAIAAPPTHAVTAAPAAHQARATASAPIDQTIPGVGTFVGSFTPTSFAQQNGQLVVNGLVNGTLTSPTGQVLQTVTNVPVTTTVTDPPSGSCNVLSLTLGPLHLDLLGLVVDLNQVNLNITAVPGAGNLLGNLLCAVAGLLNGPGLNGLANLLNQLLGL